MGFEGRRTAVGAGRFFGAVDAPDFLPVSFRDVFFGTGLLLFDLSFGRGRAFAGLRAAFERVAEDFFFFSFFRLAIRLQHRSPPASPVWSQRTIRAACRPDSRPNRLASVIRVF
jgi:hypothetical protein